jgi:hypothetical protein
MYRKFVNARSPLRLLEKGLHGGLGIGNLGVLVAGHGVGKSSFLVGVGLDELLRGGTVLHVALDQTVSHVRDYYDTVYDALAASTRLEDASETHIEIDNHRRIRAYKATDFNAGKLADAVKIESEAGARPTLIVVDGLDTKQISKDDLGGIRALAQELAAEVWFTIQDDKERTQGLPKELEGVESLISVILVLEPEGDEVTLRVVKDHANEDLQDLHVGLDPRTLLLVRS